MSDMKVCTILRDMGTAIRKATPVEIVEENGQLAINVEGYGSCGMDDGMGTSILIEVYEGVLRVILWADINEEEPTHIIEMEGAKESARKEDDDA